MKNILKKFNIMRNQSEGGEGSTSSKKGIKSKHKSSSDKLLHSSSYHSTEHKPFAGISGWFQSVANRQSPSLSSSANVSRNEIMEPFDSVCGGGGVGLDVASDSVRPDSGSSNSRDPEIEEEYQIQLAMEISAKEDPEAAQIEAVKQISMGTCAPDNTQAEVVAYRYWNYNALGYDDKIFNGFYDLYGIVTETSSDKMPSLVDLQGTPASDSVKWEAVLVNRTADSNLVTLEQKASEMVVNQKLNQEVVSNKVQKLAILVANHMGGPVADPEGMSRAWKSLSSRLKATLGSMVLPLGSLTVGLSRHRAILFKVLADTVGIPCRLVKGQQYTGSDEVAMSFVKIDDGREYIVDLMADPGTLIPSDATASPVDYEESLFLSSPLSRDIDSSQVASSSSGVGSFFEENSDSGVLDKRSKSKNFLSVEKGSDDSDALDSSPKLSIVTESDDQLKRNCGESKAEKATTKEIQGRLTYPYIHARSPSWTEGVSAPAVRRMKAKDVSQYMIDAAKENPQLAQKLHDVLLESGVVAPPNLFSDYHDQDEVSIVEVKLPTDEKDTSKREIRSDETQICGNIGHSKFLPPLPHSRVPPRAVLTNKVEQPKPVEGFGISLPFNARETTEQKIVQTEVTPVKYAANVPVAAAAAAAAVASSMMVAVAKSSNDSDIKLPVAAAATATAAAVVATTAAVTKQYERGIRSDETDSANPNSEGERSSDRSVSSSRSDVALDDVAEYEIPWEEITLGERIGLGSYGEVYRGDWHGTEVAVKRFLDQDISGESLNEFISEVRIMKRVRHPNVVLFMGAVTRPPNLSIITEFLPRGSLYRLLHRPNNQLDERRRLRMALDAARGMNYLHTCSPVIVHRDLKSPNLLVDKNWVVKVCDFGLSKMKHSTFLSSRSTAGTAEWMAPEVLRNEPSNEKCDVYSFGVILWELCTLQQPWGGMNPMQVVGAVGFQHRRLEIPNDLDPAIADIIRKCWQTDPKLRPTFAEIMAALKPLQKPITGSQVPKLSAPSSSSRGRE